MEAEVAIIGDRILLIFWDVMTGPDQRIKIHVTREYCPGPTVALGPNDLRCRRALQIHNKAWLFVPSMNCWLDVEPKN